MIKRVNLTNGSTEISPVNTQWQCHYLGGLGLSARMMAEIGDMSLSPLDPGLPLIVSVGTLTTTGFPGANKACFFGVSPLTGLTAGSWLGGDFGTAFGRSDTLVLVLEGKAETPSIVIVRPEGVEIVPRSDLWGKTVSETRRRLQEDYPDLKSAVIGPAGESLVEMANVRGDESHAAGRCGMGAVMGSKNIKAILAGGSAKFPVADPQTLKSISRQTMQAIRESPFLNEVQGPIGTPQLVAVVNGFHAFPTGNHQERYFETADRISGETIVEEYVFKRTTCPGCPVRCRLHVRIDGEEMDAAEYETVWSFGGDNRVDDYALIARANRLCNDYGIDTISAGNTIAFYREYTNTMDDPSNILDLIRQISTREGDGDVLAGGSRRAASRWGADYAMQVKGLELAAYDPRKYTGMAISYSTANRGGCHSRAWTVADEMSGVDFTGAELGRMVAEYHAAGCVRDSLITCTFLDGTIRPFYAPALTAILGESYDTERLALIGDRIYTLERALNVQRGADNSLDKLPRRIMEGMVSPDKYREGMEEFYRVRGWDADGRPTAEKLASLGLEFMI
ncbi:MAG: aldehyde ferredoxin oxidoreductase family protein [Anaerolineales bacterium]|nr:aldehyde ferredoxin oxidoreductase family protein [Anaerolineales bacterium]